MKIMTSESNSPEIDISILEPEWESSFLEVEDIVHTAISHTLKMATLPSVLQGRDVEVSAVLANDDLVQVLNREYRSKDSPTNVLSFANLDSDDPLPETGPVHIGDIILAFQTVAEEAKDQGKFFKDHFTHLVVHGTLHLLGYDHIDEHEANNMESLEIRILEKLGIQNPYTETNFMA